MTQRKDVRDSCLDGSGKTQTPDKDNQIQRARKELSDIELEFSERLTALQKKYDIEIDRVGMLEGSRKMEERWAKVRIEIKALLY